MERAPSNDREGVSKGDGEMMVIYKKGLRKEVKYILI